MNRIILAYCRDNAELAETTEQKLGRIGIPFEHITDLSDEQGGSFGQKLSASEDPVVLFVTENLLKSRACLTDTLPALNALIRDKRLLAVVADGKVHKDDGSVEYVETHFDRMGHALQYMNFWQSAWLDLSQRHQHAEDGEKTVLETEMNAVHHIANDIGEIISALREAGFVTQHQFEADDYAVFFHQFGLQEWHEQYRRIAESFEQEYIPPIPQTAPQIALAGTPVVTGLLSPSPADTEGIIGEMPKHNGQPAEPEAHWHALEAEEDLPADIPEPETNLTETTFPDVEDEHDAAANGEAGIEQAIRDAWVWLEKGHIERGLELLRFTCEQYPDNERLKSEYESALAKYQTFQETEIPDAPDMVFSGETSGSAAFAPEETDVLQEEHAGNGQSPETNEARSYDLMGNMAAEKGDYLFAKYCWDRAVEIDPAYPGIFRKLGLMTSEHLQDYRETAIHYLKKALEQAPDDADVHLALAGATLLNGDRAQAEVHYTQAVMLDPSMRTAENDRLYQPAAAPPQEIEVEEERPEPVAVETAPEQLPVVEKREVLTVLITGATSGIGRATAELFARHGHRVVLTGRRIEHLVMLKAQFEEEYHSDVLMLPFDVRERGAAQAALENLPESWQNIDILINNAGLAKGLAPIHEGNIDHWEQMIDTNIKGLLYVTRAIAPGMVARRRGHIINIGSSAGKEVYANGNVYCATKFAVDALTRAMRLDLHAHNIRVSQVSPGHVEETEFAITRFDGDEERARIYNDFQPLKSSEVAETIYWMATRPPHVNVQDVWMYATQQASSTVIERSGR